MAQQTEQTLQRVQGRRSPQNYFLTRDENGKTHWFLGDPMKTPKGRNVEIEDIASEVFTLAGIGDVANPILVSFIAGKINRCLPFNIHFPSDIRAGRVNMHFEDLEGSVIEIPNSRNSNIDFPFNAIVLGSNGAIIETRTYAFSGDCSDGVESHRIVAVKGPSPYAPEELENDEGADGDDEAGEHGESPEEGREGGVPQKNDSMDL